MNKIKSLWQALLKKPGGDMRQASQLAVPARLIAAYPATPLVAGLSPTPAIYRQQHPQWPDRHRSTRQIKAHRQAVF